jgi:hypothetical protein
MSRNMPIDIDLMQNFVEIMKLPVNSRYCTLGSLLRRYRRQEFLDKRDQDYAQLSLASDSHEIVPNYERSRVDLFFELGGTVDELFVLREALGMP